MVTELTCDTQRWVWDLETYHVNVGTYIDNHVENLPNHIGKKLSSKSKSKPCCYQSDHSIGNV